MPARNGKKLLKAIGLLGKKRGSRRTGSEQVGSLTLGGFFATMLALGVALAVLILRELVIPQWHLQHEFIQTECTIVDRRLDAIADTDPPRFHPSVRIRFLAGDKPQDVWTEVPRRDAALEEKAAHAALAPFAVGERHACWFDLTNPAQAVLARDISWFPWLMLLLPISFLSLGSGGLVYLWLGWGKSVERQAVLQERGASGDLFRSAPPRDGTPRREFPAVPDPANLSDSPGITLAFRLPVTTSPFWIMVAVISVCVAINLMGLWFLTVAWLQFRDVAFNPQLTAFSIAWLVAGGYALYRAVRRMAVVAGLGATIVEVCSHPLRAGETYRLFFQQHGNFTANMLQVLLVCEEIATYRQGTDTRTERRRVYEQELFLREGFHIRPNEPLEVRCPFSLPADVMHSFRGRCNEIEWSIVVEADVLRHGFIERNFPIVVYPRSQGRRVA